jgi:hypothetical protein
MVSPTVTRKLSIVFVRFFRAPLHHIDVEFTPQGGNTTRVALSNLNFLEDNLNGTYLPGNIHYSRSFFS